MSTNSEKNILYGGPIPKENKIPNSSLGEYLLEKLQSLGDAVLMIDGSTSKQMTASEILWESVQLANSLKKIGIKIGDIVGIVSENRFEFAIVSLATLYLGATVTTFSTAYTESELKHTTSLSRPKVIFASPAAIDNVSKVASKTKYIKYAIVFASKTNYRNVINYDDFLHGSIGSVPAHFHCPPVNVNENICLIMYSSGTTGLPKGVKLSQANMICVLEQRMAPQLEFEQIILSVIPFFHVYGFAVMIAMINNFKNSVFLPRFIDRQYIGCIQKYKITSVIAAPPLLVFLAKTPLLAEYDVSSVKIISSGAAPLAKSVIEEIQRRFNNPRMRNGYGMTEATVALTGQTDNNHKHGSVGALRSEIYGKVLDMETGKILGPNQIGELVFKGPNIMHGYVNNLKATKEMIDEDGWLHTGDVGYYDDDQEWYIIDRLKELIKYKGHQVPPAELEAVLLQHPKVADACVVGLPDDDAGELPLAFVVKKVGEENATETEIVEFVNGQVSPVKRLRGGVRFIEVIPKSAAGKILRKDLRKLLTPKSKL